MNKICVTGASGFIGRSLCEALVSSNKSITGFIRNSESIFTNSRIEQIQVGNINSETNWTNHLYNCECIIHCAGKAHSMSSTNNFDDYYSINTQGTKRLAEQAVEAGVKRLVFLSTLKVNGESTDIINDLSKFTNFDIPNPKDNYATSKYKAENILWEIASKTELEVVVIRLPLVYGYGVKGNLQKLIKLLKSNIPLPFSLVKNKRSFIGIDNLIDVIIKCIDHPKAIGKTFLVSDDQDLSTPELLKYIAKELGHSPVLFPIPISILNLLAFVSGKQNEVNRLIGSSQADISFTKKTLNWTPNVSIQEGISRMVQKK